MSEVQRQTMRQAGAIRRISVAVLVDGITTIDVDGARSWAPRPVEEVQALRQLVTAAVGFDETRGDIVTIESMEFEPDDQIGALVEVGPWMRLIERNTMTLIQIGALSLVALVLALTVIKPLLTRAPRALHQGAAGPAIALAGPDGRAAETVGGAPGLPAPDGAPSGVPGSVSSAVSGAASGSISGGARAADGHAPTGETLRLAVAEQPEESVTMLREWLSPETQPVGGGREAA